MSEIQTTLGRRTGVSLWRQISQILHLEISRGDIKPGGKLPTEPDLARRFGVNRHTVRRALAELQEEGLLSIEQGRGTFVSEHLSFEEEPPHHVGDIGRAGREADGELVSSHHKPAAPNVAAALALRPGEDVILLELVHLVNHRPVSVASHYFPAHRFAGFEAAFSASHSITKALSSFGVTNYLQKQTRVTASLPSAADAHLLKMPRGQPIVVAENVNVDLEGRPIEFTISRSAGNRTQLVFDR